MFLKHLILYSLKYIHIIQHSDAINVTVLAVRMWSVVCECFRHFTFKDETSVSYWYIYWFKKYSDRKNVVNTWKCYQKQRTPQGDKRISFVINFILQVFKFIKYIDIYLYANCFMWTIQIGLKGLGNSNWLTSFRYQIKLSSIVVKLSNLHIWFLLFFWILKRIIMYEMPVATCGLPLVSCHMPVATCQLPLADVLLFAIKAIIVWYRMI